jgi:hypothetical protein
LREEKSMWGIDDPWIIIGYGLAIVFTIACVLYGWWKRNEVDEG